jgi:hypothetical protein
MSRNRDAEGAREEVVPPSQERVVALAQSGAAARVGRNTQHKHLGALSRCVGRKPRRSLAHGRETAQRDSGCDERRCECRTVCSAECEEQVRQSPGGKRRAGHAGWDGTGRQALVPDRPTASGVKISRLSRARPMGGATALEGGDLVLPLTHSCGMAC